MLGSMAAAHGRRLAAATAGTRETGLAVPAKAELSRGDYA